MRTFSASRSSVGRDDAAFAGDQQLGRAQAVDVGIALAADRCALVARAKSVRRVEDQADAMAAGNFL